MKTLLKLSVALLFISSCKKQYTCQCKEAYEMPAGTIQYRTSYTTYNERTRDKAQSACVAKSAGAIGRSCVITD